MSTTAVTAKKKEPGMVQLVVTLLVISAVVALLLGLVNMITAPQIAINTQEKTNAAMAEVLPYDGEYVAVEYDAAANPVVTAMYQAGDAGYVVQVAPSGFSGNLDMMVGVNADGTVAGVSIISHAETSGLGANATKAEWREQFKGLSGSVAVTKDGGTIDSITGATITSRAVSDGVNAALNAAASMG